MEYFKKYERNPVPDLAWNIPERPQGSLNIIGGNAQNFRTIIKIAEWAKANYPLQNIHAVMPDALRSVVPPLPELIFLTSTSSGSFASRTELLDTFNAADYNILLGDLSKNSITGKAAAEACTEAEKPLIITRDAVDLLASQMSTEILTNHNLILIASIVQLQKVFRAAYYPKILLAQHSLSQVSETLHKFTLSYQVSLVTVHNGQVVVAKDGIVAAVAIRETGCSPLTFWGGELATRVATYNLYNPNRWMDATICALFA